MNFRAVLVLPKTAGSAQTHKTMSFIWIVWSTLYVYLWGKPANSNQSDWWYFQILWRSFCLVLSCLIWKLSPSTKTFEFYSRVKFNLEELSKSKYDEYFAPLRNDLSRQMRWAKCFLCSVFNHISHLSTKSINFSIAKIKGIHSYECINVWPQPQYKTLGQ